MTPEQIEAEVHRIMALPDDEQVDEIAKMIRALSPDRRQTVMAYLLNNPPEEKPP